MIGHILSDFLDWGPLRLICDLTWGPPAEFGVAAAAVSKSNVRGLLKSHGIKSWGYHFSSGGSIFGGLMKLLINRVFSPKVIASTKEETAQSEVIQPTTVKELLFSVNKKKAGWTLKVLAMHKYPVTRAPRIALKRKRRTKKWRL